MARCGGAGYPIGLRPGEVGFGRGSSIKCIGVGGEGILQSMKAIRHLFVG